MSRMNWERATRRDAERSGARVQRAEKAAKRWSQGTLIRSRWGGKCADCDARIEKGETARYDGAMHHVKCGAKPKRGHGEHTWGGRFRSVKPAGDDLAWMLERNPALTVTE